MVSKRFCPCCQKESSVYRNNKTLKWEKYCLKCYDKYTHEERKAMEFKQILDIISGLKIDNKLKDLNLEGEI